MCLSLCEIQDERRLTDKVTNMTGLYSSSVARRCVQHMEESPVWVWRWKSEKSDFLHFLLRHRKLPESCQEQEGPDFFWLRFSTTCLQLLFHMQPPKKARDNITACSRTCWTASVITYSVCWEVVYFLFLSHHGELDKNNVSKRLITMLSMYWHFLLLLCKFLWTHCRGCGTGTLILCRLNDGWPFPFVVCKPGGSPHASPDRTQGV